MKKGLKINNRFFYGGNAIIITIMVVGIIVLLNLLIGQFNLRVDLTENKIYSLSPQTKNVLKDLDEKIEIIGVFQSGGLKQQVEDLLKEYRSYSDKIEYRFIDPDKEPSIIKKYEVTSYDTLVIVKGDRIKKILRSKILTTPLTYDEPPKFQGEQEITRAILALSQKETQKIYFITGHEELSLLTDLNSLESDLSGEGFEVESLNLVEKGQIPDDASVIVLAGPKRDLDQREVEALDTYMQKGGSLIALIDPIVNGDRLDSVKGLVEKWGVKLHDDIVLDVQNNFYFDPLTLIPRIVSHEITNEIKNNQMVVVMPYARSMEVVESQNRKDTRLLYTHESAWGETNFTDNRPKYNEDSDFKGPLLIGAVVTTSIAENEENKVEESNNQTDSNENNAVEEKKESNLLVIGTSSFLREDVLKVQGNRDFFLNIAQWMAGEKEQLTIRPRNIEYNRVILDQKTGKRIFYTTVLVIPLLILATGTFIWFRRRNL